MSLLYVIIIVAVAGFVLYLVNRPGTPIDGKIKTIINWFVVIVVIIWLLKITGILNVLSGVKV